MTTQSSQLLRKDGKSILHTPYNPSKIQLLESIHKVGRIGEKITIFVKLENSWMMMVLTDLRQPAFKLAVEKKCDQ